MKEKPIIFSGAMVRAILEGRKTQTRRIVKPQPTTEHGLVFEGVSLGGFGSVSDREINAPYDVGTILWVREAFRYVRTLGVAEAEGDPEVIEYRCGPEVKSFQKGIWKPSIHMPREASRITLEVTAVRCERLQDISEADAMKEGLEDHGYSNLNYLTKQVENIHPKESFQTLWQSIHGPDSWSLNPWVWVYEFRRVKP